MEFVSKQLTPPPLENRFDVRHNQSMSHTLKRIDLADFILNQMRMNHIYQPVMLKVLLEGSGTASLEDIAKALLSYDPPQIEYYGLRTKRMVGDVMFEQNDEWQT